MRTAATETPRHEAGRFLLLDTALRLHTYRFRCGILGMGDDWAEVR